jgi:hypothetical protein
MTISLLCCITVGSLLLGAILLGIHLGSANSPGLLTPVAIGLLGIAGLLALYEVCFKVEDPKRLAICIPTFVLVAVGASLLGVGIKKAGSNIQAEKDQANKYMWAGVGLLGSGILVATVGACSHMTSMFYYY